MNESNLSKGQRDWWANATPEQRAARQAAMTAGRRRALTEGRTSAGPRPPASMTSEARDAIVAELLARGPGSRALRKMLREAVPVAPVRIIVAMSLRRNGAKRGPRVIFTVKVPGRTGLRGLKGVVEGAILNAVRLPGES